jgi:hypothetical protein
MILSVALRGSIDYRASKIASDTYFVTIAS